MVQNNFHNLRVLQQIVKAQLLFELSYWPFSLKTKNLGSDTPTEFDIRYGFPIE